VSHLLLLVVGQNVQHGYINTFNPYIEIYGITVIGGAGKKKRGTISVRISNFFINKQVLVVSSLQPLLVFKHPYHLEILVSIFCYVIMNDLLLIYT
jgi:hypothetical protein